MESTEVNTNTARGALAVPALMEGFADVARRLLDSVPDLSRTERQMLHDYSRQESRYQMLTLDRFTTIARRSTRPEDQESLSALVLSRCVPAETVEPFVAALDETRAQGPADVLVQEFLHRPTLATKDRALRALDCHAAQLRRVRRSVEAVTV